VVQNAAKNGSLISFHLILRRVIATMVQCLLEEGKTTKSHDIYRVNPVRGLTSASPHMAEGQKQYPKVCEQIKFTV